MRSAMDREQDESFRLGMSACGLVLLREDIAVTPYSDDVPENLSRRQFDSNKRRGFR